MNLEQALILRREGKNEEARTHLVRLAHDHPNDARVQYETACVHDVLGQESEAVPYYLQAMDLGLPDNLLQEAYLGLGSTYRTLGRYQESENIFAMGLSRFPEARELSVFNSMTLYNLGRHKESVSTLLRIIAETSMDNNISQYSKAILLYSSDLDKKW